MSYQLIVGLGNPGSEYASTRHNAGFRVLDAFAREHGAVWSKDRGLKGEVSFIISPEFGKLTLVKPITFMNASGDCVQKASSYYRIPPEKLVVIYDELNLALGEVKLSDSGSAGGHNGLEDILRLIAPRFARLRIGIGPKPLKEMALADYVLGKFTAEEDALFSASMERYLDSLERLLRDGAAKAMNHINRKQKNDDSNRI